MTGLVPVLAIWGDSEMVSLGDWFAVPFRGFVERALAGNYPYVNVSRHSSHVSQVVPVPAVGSASAFAPLEYRQRWRIVRAANCTHVLSGYGVNDLGGDTLAVTQANLLAHWTELTSRGLKVWQYTLPPLVNTSTDGWITLAGQTVSSSDPKRVQLNAWIRAGAPVDPSTKAAVAVGTSGALLAGQSGHSLRGYVETSDSWESARDSGKWKVPERVVNDAAVTAGTSSVTSATAAFTSADVGKIISINGSGASGTPFATTITGYVSATQVNLLAAPSTTISGALCGIGNWTGDGQHPGPNGHAAAAAAIASSLAAALAS